MIPLAPRYDWTTWILGVERALIGGGSGSVVGALGPMAVDAEHFNLLNSGGMKHLAMSMGISFMMGGLIHFFTFLHLNPSPKKVAE